MLKETEHIHTLFGRLSSFAKDVILFPSIFLNGCHYISEEYSIECAPVHLPGCFLDISSVYHPRRSYYGSLYGYTAVMCRLRDKANYSQNVIRRKRRKICLPGVYIICLISYSTKHRIGRKLVLNAGLALHHRIHFRPNRLQIGIFHSITACIRFFCDLVC